MGALADAISGTSKSKLGAVLAVAILTVGFFTLIAIKLTNADMVPLYSNLSLKDSASIVTELEKTGTPYDLTAGGTQILVPADRVLRIRMNMAEQQLPGGGSLVGYEIFDREESFGSSNFVMNVNMMRALEGELSRTVGALSGVDMARVHLVMPKRELFTRQRAKPSASVTIKMRGGSALERAEVTAVTHLVASAVPGLEASMVTVVDGHGKLLARGDGSEGMSGMAGNAQEQRTAFESRMQIMLEGLLEKVVGVGKVRVQVFADMNFDRVVTNSEKYDPDGQVARSTQSNSEVEKASEAGGESPVSVTQNLPQGGADGGGGSNSNREIERSGETTNFEISKTIQNHIREGGTVNKLSVAVLVDGIYSAAEEDEDPTYSPRSEEELTKLRSLVSTAIGYDEKRGDKIELVNMAFSKDDMSLEEASFFERFKLEVQGIAQTLIIALVAILAILLVLRPAVVQLVKQTGSPSQQVSSELAALEAPPGGAAAADGTAAAGALPAASAPPPSGDSGEAESTIDVANIKGGMKSSSMKQVNEIVDQYPEETMNVLRQWMLRQA